MKLKLTTRNLTTHADTQWEIGKKITAKEGEMKLCSDTCLHYYNDPLLAVLLNPVHANISNPRMFQIKTSKEFITDGLKCGCKKQTLIKEIELPEITTTQKIAFAILVSLKVCKEKSFLIWGKNWLSNKNRTANAAYAANAAANAVYAVNAAVNPANAAYAVNAAYAAAKVANAAYPAANVKINFKAIAKRAMKY